MNLKNKEYYWLVGTDILDFKRVLTICISYIKITRDLDEYSTLRQSQKIVQ